MGAPKLAANVKSKYSTVCKLKRGPKNVYVFDLMGLLYTVVACVEFLVSRTFWSKNQQFRPGHRLQHTLTNGTKFTSSVPSKKKEKTNVQAERLYTSSSFVTDEKINSRLHGKSTMLVYVLRVRFPPCFCSLLCAVVGILLITNANWS